MPWFLMNPIGEMTKGLIFVDQSKTGSTTMCRVFERAVCKSNGHLGGGHTPAIFIRDNYLKMFTSYHTFSVIRNPYDRFISAYFFRHLIPQDREISEEAFRKVKIDNLAPPMISQKNFVSDEEGNIIVDQLIRYENVKEEVGKMIDHLKIPYADANDFDRFSFQKTKSKGPWRGYYEKYPELWGIVTNMYGGDIKLWKSLSQWVIA